MPITYAGITPALLIDTTDLQNTEKLSRQQGKLVKNRNGVCMAMVVDWLQKSQQQPGGVTDKSQLKSGLALSLAQTAYMRYVFQKGTGQTANKEGYVQNMGMSIENSANLNKKFFSTKKGRLKDLALACTFGGHVLISIKGNGGHALGYRQIGGTSQFFDPNEGVLVFNTVQDFAKWFPAYIVGEYPDLTDTLEYARVEN
ncbi:YopT-type cysteine protease domain-containing protein [Acidicapsa dinghuensis]|uniref:YopT-type cysteine protease domain-containing protein n=1 Tax=Acidicapsa dinghuensis TaxID=2218256 RepID=A0ABW1EJP5_9BACT|nr:YopT-type cysteine protease domain-containing protein [Acidicapsa dinghuensis]